LECDMSRLLINDRELTMSDISAYETDLAV
jgi:hypothetical protein